MYILGYNRFVFVKIFMDQTQKKTRNVLPFRVFRLHDSLFL